MVNLENEQTTSATSAPPRSTDDLTTRFMNRVFRRKEGSRSNRPWDSWELDRKFFQALSQWTIDHPETSLERVLDDIRDGLEHSKDMLSLIPDSPFPARGLVTALACLLKLGVKIWRAQKDVYEFSKDVVRWVGEVKSAFESSEDGPFTWSAWQDLKHMRKLINEICSWAVERLNDGRWSRIGHGIRIQGEIQEFNERISNARALFQDLSAINMARGLDAILAGFQKLLQRQHIIVNELKKIRKTQELQLTRIIDELQERKLVAERDRFLAEALAGHTVSDATYDKQGKRPCDPDTRVEVLAEINSWIADISFGTENFLWLAGDPGCGKSALTASVAKECRRNNVLWAQFFINRNNAETTDPNSYFPSIASQLARRSPEVAEVLQTALVKDRTLTDGISADQAAKLFIDSVQCASRLDTQKPVVVVIDGLDETHRGRLESTAKTFSTLFTSLEAFSNVKVLISSRTENVIQRSFDRKHVKRVYLDTADASSIRDVSVYIKKNLLNIVKEHDLNWDVWPGDLRSRSLGDRASGLFIWGVTAVTFIQEQLYSHGEECLDDVLNMLTAEVLEDINALYMFILNVTHKDHQDEWEPERFRRIVGAIVFVQEPLCIDHLAALLDLRKTPSSKLADITHFVRRFRTILVTGTDAIDGSTVPRIHKSVFEFITSDSVDKKFRVNVDHAHLELGVQCLAYLGAARESVTQDNLTVPFRYASRFWLSHFSQANVIGHARVCADHRQSPSARSLPSHSVDLVSSVHKPIQIQYSAFTAQINAVAEQSNIWDVTSGALDSRHTDTVTCIVFSPDNRQIVSCSKDQTIKVWNSASGEWIRTLVKYSSPFNSIAFSPDGNRIVSGSSDGLVCLWAYSTGAPIGKPFRGHKKPVTCVAFSSDGNWLVAGSDDSTCMLWSTRSGRVVGQPWTGHKSPLRSVAFSSRGQRVCSVDNRRCIAWDVSSGRRTSIGSLHWQYNGDLICVSFSPEDDNVVALGGWEGVKILSRNREWTVPDSLDTRCLSFSLDGKEIAFSTWDTISVATIGPNESNTCVIRMGNYPDADAMVSAALSTTFDFFVYADDAHAIHLYNLQHDETSIKAVPIDIWTPTLLVPRIGGEKELMDVLSRMKKTQHIHDSVQNSNRRLSGTTWYEEDSIAESAIQACVVKDEVIIAGYRDGSISVWDSATSKTSDASKH